MLKIQTTNNRYFWENSREGSSTHEVLTLHIPAAPTIIFVYSLEWTFPMVISSTTGKLNIYSRLWKTIWSMHWKAFPWFSLLENSPKWSISEFWKLDHYSNNKTAGAIVDGLKRGRFESCHVSPSSSCILLTDNWSLISPSLWRVCISSAENNVLLFLDTPYTTKWRQWTLKRSESQSVFPTKYSQY